MANFCQLITGGHTTTETDYERSTNWPRADNSKTNNLSVFILAYDTFCYDVSTWEVY